MPFMMQMVLGQHSAPRFYDEYQNMCDHAA